MRVIVAVAVSVYVASVILANDITTVSDSCILHVTNTYIIVVVVLVLSCHYYQNKVTILITVTLTLSMLYCTSSYS